jgi:hypothetical protein
MHVASLAEATSAWSLMYRRTSLAQLHENLPELALIEGNKRVAIKPDESLSPSLFTFRSLFATVHRR